MRWLLVGLLALIGGGAAALLLWVRASLPPLDGVEVAPDIRAEILIERDKGGRATVRAGSRTDMAFGIGYAHGQDRFFQMDLLRRAGGGTLAALIGPAGVGIDQGARLHNLARTARLALEQATPAERAAVEAYAKGVRAGLASLSAQPWEYILPRRAPEPWRPVDTYLVALAMFRDLQDETNSRETVLDAASRALEPEVFALLTTSPGPWEAPVEGATGRWPEVRIPESGPARQGIRDGAKAASDTIRADTDPAPAGVGSNAFAVSGSRTADGRAILANDMHLGLRVPTTWYPLRLIRSGARPLDAVGVSLPGAPALVVGSNGRIAWGLTNSYGDWLDHVALELDPEDPSRYRTPDGWRRLRERHEHIDVADAEPVTVDFSDSIWGPVVGRDSEGHPLVLRWVAQEPAALNLRLLELAEQTDVEKALDLAPGIGVPAQNIIVAGADGTIGWTLMGRIPRRVGLDGPRHRSWADGTAGWQGWLDPREVPRIAPGEEARLWTANARVVSLAEQAVLGDGGYDLGARASRIRDLLDGQDRLDEQQLFAIQLDTRATLMGSWKERLEALIETEDDLPESARLGHILADWTGGADIGSASYRLVHDWRDQVTRALLTGLGSAIPGLANPLDIRHLARTEVAVWAILDARPTWVPDGYESWQALERACLERALASWGEPEGWGRRTWGEHNTTAIAHPLSRALPRWISTWIDMPEREVPGDSNVPRVAAPAFGASERLVVAPGAESEGLLQLPGGPNANPFASTRLGDYEAWVAGRPVPLPPGPAAHRRRLVPEVSSPH